MLIGKNLIETAIYKDGEAIPPGVLLVTETGMLPNGDTYCKAVSDTGFVIGIDPVGE